MARRRRNDAGGGTLILAVLLLAALGWLIEFVKTNQNAIFDGIIIVVVIGTVILIVARIQRGRRRRAEADEARQALEAERAREQVRRHYLLTRYNDEHIVNAIMGRQVWVGMTREQLVESWGHPHDIKQTILKTKRKDEFKYTNVGVNRYLSRVFLENDEVVGWKQ